MKLFTLTFSPTGGTQRVADLLARGIAREAIPINLCNRGISEVTLTQEDVALVVMPVYGGRIPATAAGRMKCITARGTRAIIVAVYGNRAFEDALVELGDICTAQGFTVVAAVSAVAEHSIARQFGAGRPDEGDSAQLSTIAEALFRKLDSGDTAPLTHLPGNRPYKEFKGGVGPTPQTADSCTECGICVAECPVNAIADDCRTITPDTCMQCGRCISVCPFGAKHFPSMMLERVNAMLATAGACERKEARIEAIKK